MVVGWVKLPRVSGHDVPAPYFWAAALITFGIAALTFGIVKLNDWGWNSYGVSLSFAAAATMLALFVAHCLRSGNPFIDPALFRIRDFAGACLTMAPFSIAFGGFLPHGWTGVLLGIAIAIFSYLGLELVSVAAGEASHPEIAVPRALRWTLARLALFYIGGMAVLVGVMPWTQAGLSESPFVRVFQATGIPFGGALMNFVVLTAALSSINAQLYLSTRLLFSLSRGSYAPKFLGILNARGVPIAALMISSVGMLVALVLDLLFQESAFLYTLGASFFGGLFGWMLIFITHLAFRRHFQKNGGSVPMRFAPPGPWSSLAGMLALIGVLISTWWIPGMKITILAGLPWLAFITLCYFLWKRTNRDRIPPRPDTG